MSRSPRRPTTVRKPAVVLSVVPQELGRAIAGACETIDVEQGDTFDGPQDHPDRLVEDEWHAQQGPFGDAFKVLRRDRGAGREGLERLPVRRVRVLEPRVRGDRLPCVAVSDAERERARDEPIDQGPRSARHTRVQDRHPACVGPQQGASRSRSNAGSLERTPRLKRYLLLELPSITAGGPLLRCRMIPVNRYAKPINTQPIPIRTLPLKMNHTPNTIHKVANTRYLTRPGLGSVLFGALRFMKTSLREADHAEVGGIRRVAVRPPLTPWIARTPWRRELAEQERTQRYRCKVVKGLGFGLQGIADLTEWRAHPIATPGSGAWPPR